MHQTIRIMYKCGEAETKTTHQNQLIILYWRAIISPRSNIVLLPSFLLQVAALVHLLLWKTYHPQSHIPTLLTTPKQRTYLEIGGKWKITGLWIKIYWMRMDFSSYYDVWCYTSILWLFIHGFWYCFYNSAQFICKYIEKYQLQTRTECLAPSKKTKCF